MYDYETVVVLHPDLGEAGVKEMIERIRSILESGKAEIKKLDEWGLRELAYTIERQHRGFYALVEHRAEPATVRELERQLRLSDQVLRFLTVRQVRKKMPPPRRTKEERSEDRAGDSGR